MAPLHLTAGEGGVSPECVDIHPFGYVDCQVSPENTKQETLIKVFWTYCNIGEYYLNRV